MRYKDIILTIRSAIKYRNLQKKTFEDTYKGLIEIFFYQCF